MTMQRHYLLIACLFPVQALACENTLVGKWQSDASASMAFNRAYAKLEERQDQFLSSLMGKMTLEVTDHDLRVFLPDTEVNVQGHQKPFTGLDEKSPYTVLTCDPYVVVIHSTDAATGESSVATYHFVDHDSMWIYNGSTNPRMPDLHIREYFRRLRLSADDRL